MARHRFEGSIRDSEFREPGSGPGDEACEPPAPLLRRMVHRTRILREIKLRSNDVSATIVMAPDGFGKTALLNQRVSDIQADPERGVARMLDAAGLDGERLYEKLGELEAHLEARMRPLIAIDNLPVLHDIAIQSIGSRIRELHAKGFEFIIACRPNNREFARSLGDSYKVGAQTLAIRPKEFSDWARMLGISGELDVYELTQGIPSLVSMLGLMDGRPTSLESFSNAVAELYRGVLEDMRKDRDSLYRTACLLVLTGSGSLRDFERIKMKVRAQSWSRIAREYPVFGVDVERGTYRCLARRSKAMGNLCRYLVRSRPLFAMRAIKILMAAGDIDRAAYVARMLERPEDALGVLAEYPSAFALSGNIDFVREMMSAAGDVTSAETPVGGVLAMQLSALVSGELRLARALAVELKRRSHEVEEQVDPASWAEACALWKMWESCRGVTPSRLDAACPKDRETPAARELAAHVRVYGELIQGAGAVSVDEYMCGIEDLSGDGISIPRVLLACDRALVEAMGGDLGDARAVDERLQGMVKRLLERRLTPIATHVRMVAAACRLLSGLPVVDERAFVDAGTMSVRTSDLATQLFCLVGEGWQALEMGQYANAMFRARQALKLAEEGQLVVVSWARMLECCAHLLNTSRMALEEETDLLDLGEAARTSVDAWTTALGLAAAHRVSELSAWCSLNKTTLLAKGFTAFARQAVALLGERASALKRVLPEIGAGWQLESAESAGPVSVRVDGRASDVDMLLSQVHIKLFGGFQVERGGHVVTDALWRRRKACVIASRLVLAGGAFVGRKEIGEEVWPDKDYLHARETLYAGLTSLRSAFGQSDEGPQYVLTQGDGVAINTEYVVSDTMRFDTLARDILLARSGMSGRQLIDACLKLDELYTGPLYVPNCGDTGYFVHQRRLYQTKFVDCMMRGIKIADELGDDAAASWLVESALRQAPLREDVVRAAMHIYDKNGRRREVVELYNSHTHVLERELHALPERETQLAYEAIIKRDGNEVLLA